jgi:hypothetical protein
LTLLVLAAAVVLGEVLLLRIGEPCPLPLSYAVYPVIAVRFEAVPFGVAVGVASLVGIALAHVPVLELARRVLARSLVAAAVFATYRGVLAVFDHRERVGVVLGALVAAAVAAVVVDEVARRALHRSSAFAGRGRLAWLALGSSGALMALGYRGVAGRGGLGLWGVLLFASPLLAAWYSFARLDAITRVARQTIDALSLAPEFGGVVPPGHAERIATLAVEVGRALRFSPSDLAALDTAARLQQLGAVTLDGDDMVEFRSADVSTMTGVMLRDIATLAEPRAVIEGRAGVASAVLRVANEYDDLTTTHDLRGIDAIEVLRSGPVHAYDPVVVDALALVVKRHVARA